MEKVELSSNCTLYCGDCLDVLPLLSDIHSVCTDPPYNLTPIIKLFGKKGSAPAQKGRDGSFSGLSKGFMGKEWDGSGIAFNQEMWSSVLNSMLPGAHLLSFGGTRTYHRMATAIEDSGFDIRDMWEWIYGTGLPKSHDVGDGWGTSVKPAHEPICLARKPLLEKTVRANREKFGTGAINIEECRLEEHPSRQNDYTPKGRFPSNVFHDGSDEVVRQFLDEENTRFFYCAKASSGERDYGLHTTEIKKAKSFANTRNGEGERFDGTETPLRANIHPTVKPLALMSILCRLITPHGGIVLDPFMGSGTTGMAALDSEFKFIGIEKEREYFDIAVKRIKFSLSERPRKFIKESFRNTLEKFS